MQEYFSMGGYGAYIWPCYGLSAALLLALLVSSIRSLKSTEAEFERLKAAVGPKKQKQKMETPNGNEA